MKLCLLLFVLVVAFALNEALKPGCRWDGTAPFCEGHCLKKTIESETVCEYDESGDGSKCWSGRKNLCCKDEAQC
uniref:Uncharacterized protein n=1 Tax=Strigamia maritima TaxID=126957 RepID=T1J7H1_STRMM